MTSSRSPKSSRPSSVSNISRRPRPMQLMRRNAPGASIRALSFIQNSYLHTIAASTFKIDTDHSSTATAASAISTRTGDRSPVVISSHRPPTSSSGRHAPRKISSDCSSITPTTSICVNAQELCCISDINDKFFAKAF